MAVNVNAAHRRYLHTLSVSVPSPQRRRRSSVSLAAVKPLRLNGRPTAGSLHQYLRRLILDGAIPNGARLSQVELAERLGVSRTPLREAMRMLQAEGIVEAEHNRRTQVTALDVGDIDTVYGCRVLMEATGVLVTVPKLDNARIAELSEAVAEMREHAADPSADRWARAHRRFHRALIPEAGREFARTLSMYFDRAERLRRMFQTEEIAGGVRLIEEHEAILRACRSKQASKAAALVARHSSRAALTLMAQIAPERDPTLVRTALQLFSALESL
jgi:DNA-binding GntR family transcriptional regulator